MINIKRAFCCVLLLFIFLTGCQKAEQIKPQTQAKSKFTLYYNEMKCTGEILTDENKNIFLSVDSPDSLKGFSAKTEGDKFTVSYKGITATYDTTDLPDGAFFKLAFYTLKKFTDTENDKFEKTDGGYICTETTDLGEVSVVLDENRFIKSIKIPSQGFTLEIEPKV